MIPLAVLLILAGLVMTWLSGNVKFPILVSIVFWVGIALVIVGLVLMLAPVVVWLDHQLRSMMGG